MKDESGGKIMKEFAASTAKTYSYLADKNSQDKKAKETKKCVIKGKHKFEDYKNYLKAIELEDKMNQLNK